MRKSLITFLMLLMMAGATFSQNLTGREELCKENYRTLFGGEALTGQGTDPEMMDILQKLIFGEVFATGDLDIRTRELITCVTLASMQTLPQLEAHAGAALNVGVTPPELREAMYLTAPFIGFPRMLNAVGTVNKVFKERGIKLPLDKAGTVTEADRHERGAAIQDSLYPGGVSAAMKGMPADMGSYVEKYLTEYCFGDIYTRGALDLKTRELLGYCVLTTIEAESQLQAHYGGSLRAGNTPEELAAAVMQCLPYIGFPPAMKALRIIKAEYQKTAPQEEKIVRLSRIEVDPACLDEYKVFLKEEIEASLRIEPGVLTLYALSEKEHPEQFTILEIYAGRTAYESHIKTPHFQKYKQGTLKMVKSLELIDCDELIKK